VNQKELNQPTPDEWISKVDTVETVEGLVICDVRHAGTHKTAANANLIAAAPDLFRVLKGLLYLFPPSHEIVSMRDPRHIGLVNLEAAGRAALAKAEGKSS